MGAIEHKLNELQETQRLGVAKKRLLHVANWSIMDEKHRKLEQIRDSVDFLRRICGNVRDHPEQVKYRKIRVGNKAFSVHVRDAPGGEEYMHEAGWQIKVADHERVWVFEGQPGSTEWLILEEACAELDKLWILVNQKLQRLQSDNKAEQRQVLEAVRRQIEEDKAERHAQFRYGDGGGGT